jgi:hypothetical protein
MKKYTAVIKKISLDVVCLDAKDPNDLFNWKDLASYEKLPRETLDKLRKLDRENEGYWEFAEIKPASAIVKNIEPLLPEIKPFLPPKLYKNPAYSIFLPEVGETVFADEVVSFSYDSQSIELRTSKKVYLSRNDFSLFCSFMTKVGEELSK